MDDFRILAMMYAGLVLLVILMHRARPTPPDRKDATTEPLAAAAE
jgi:hypothetical protein